MDLNTATNVQYEMMTQYCSMQLRIEGGNEGKKTIRRLKDRAWNKLQDIAELGQTIKQLQQQQQIEEARSRQKPIQRPELELEPTEEVVTDEATE